MRQQGMHSVGARLLGLYFLVHGLSLVPTVLATALTLRAEVDGLDQFGQMLALGGAAQSMLLVAAGVLLVFWRRVPSPIEAFVEPVSLLWVGLNLLGIYFVVSGASDVLWGAVRGAGSDTVTGYAKAIAGAMELGAGCLLLVYAKSLASPRRASQ